MCCLIVIIQALDLSGTQLYKQRIGDTGKAEGEELSLEFM